MRVSAERPVTHRCPFVDERDLGTVYASWEGDAVEFHAFAAHLDTYAERAITHETMTTMVAQWLTENGAKDVDVVTSWRTAGLDVEVTA